MVHCTCTPADSRCRFLQRLLAHEQLVDVELQFLHGAWRVTFGALALPSLPS